MDTTLVIVESPAKAKTIKKYLGKGYQVLASVGHVVDLPVREFGVEIENNFAPKYVVIRGKAKVLKQITDAAATAKDILLAPDPDREGEAIAWHIAKHIAQALKPRGKAAGAKLSIRRAMFNEITASAIKAAISHPMDLNKNLFEAQQARRVLDRIVGYKISPLLWDKVKRGLSAGRVQSVAVRLVCDREKEVQAFVKSEYWSIVTKLKGSLPPPFEAKVIRVDGKDAEIPNETLARQWVAELESSSYVLKSIKRAERRRRPTPPFITSKLQQEAARKLGFTAKRTMAVAQQLYEGVEIGDEGLVGLITYMRTDSTRVGDEALSAVREHIRGRYGPEFLPETAIRYQGKKGAQDAHEAVRPTNMDLAPDKVENYLDRDAWRLYDLIWKRFVASQMNPAVYDQTSLDIESGRFLLRASGQVLKFQGFMAVYMEDEDEVKEKDEEENPELPDLKEGEKLSLLGIEPHQHFTQPPPRFTEASLVKELEEKGIGRPSTYASIMSTIQDKGYVEKVDKRFFPTELGKLVNELLVESFPTLLDVGFTAQMETELDEVEEGRRVWTSALQDFYGPFETALAAARDTMRNVKKETVATKIKCEKCGSFMVIKWGRHGEFLACSAYPDCRCTKEFTRTSEGEIEIKPEETTTEVCDKCGSPMVVRRGRFGAFVACSKYPECKSTRSIGTGVNCPACKEGHLVQKNSKKGALFYACDRFPACKFAMWDRPLPEACPNCNYPLLAEKFSKKTGETYVTCTQKDCTFRRN